MATQLESAGADMEVSFPELNFPSLFIISYLLTENMVWGGPGGQASRRFLHHTVLSCLVPHAALPLSQCTHCCSVIGTHQQGRRHLGPHGLASVVDASFPTATYLGPPLAPSHSQTP